MRKSTPPLSLTPAQQAAVDALCEHSFRFVRRSKHAIQDEVDGHPFYDEEHHLHYACRHCGLAAVVDANEGPVPPPVPDDAPCVVLVRGIISHDEDATDRMSPADSLDPSVDGILTDGNFRYTLGSFRGRGGRKTDLSPDGWSPSIAALAAYEDDATHEGVVEAREWCAFLRRWSEVLNDRESVRQSGPVMAWLCFFSVFRDALMQNDLATLDSLQEQVHDLPSHERLVNSSAVVEAIGAVPVIHDGYCMALSFVEDQRVGGEPIEAVLVASVFHGMSTAHDYCSRRADGVADAYIQAEVGDSIEKLNALIEAIERHALYEIDLDGEESAALVERVLALPAPRRLSESKHVAAHLASLLDEWTEVAPSAPLRPYVDAVAETAASSVWANRRLPCDWTPSRWLVYIDAVAFQLAAWCGVAESFRLNVEDDVAALVNDIDALVQEIEYIFLDRLGPGSDVEADEIDAVAEWLVDWDYEPCYVRDMGSSGCDICSADLSEDYARRGDHIFVLVEKRRPDGSQRDILKSRREEWDHHFQGHYYQYRVEQMILRRPSDIEEDGWEFMDSCSGFLETEPYDKDNYVHTEAREVVARVVKDRADEGAVVFDLGVFDRD
jgi:hypothetical protein